MNCLNTSKKENLMISWTMYNAYHWNLSLIKMLHVKNKNKYSSYMVNIVDTSAESYSKIEVPNSRGVSF